MTRRLDEVFANFLELLADSTEPVDIGQVGPSEHYLRAEASMVGPTVSALESAGLITKAGIGQSCRPSRKGTIGWRWMPLNREACRRKAEEYRKRARTVGDDEPPNGPTQGLLF